LILNELEHFFRGSLYGLDPLLCRGATTGGVKALERRQNELFVVRKWLVGRASDPAFFNLNPAVDGTVARQITLRVSLCCAGTWLLCSHADCRKTMVCATGTNDDPDEAAIPSAVFQSRRT
jgi:hypothetical protein